MSAITRSDFLKCAAMGAAALGLTAAAGTALAARGERRPWARALGCAGTLCGHNASLCRKPEPPAPCFCVRATTAASSTASLSHQGPSHPQGASPTRASFFAGEVALRRMVIKERLHR